MPTTDLRIKKKRILITGGTGFVGRCCVKNLKQQGHEVLCIGRNRSDDIFCDLSDPASCLELAKISKVDAFVHLAARVGWDGSSLSQMYTPNVLATSIFAHEVFLQSSLMVFASAAIVCGSKSAVISDLSVAQPDTPYAESKLLAEDCIKASGCDSTIMRIGGIFGNKGPNHLGLNRVIKDAKKGVPPHIYGNGEGKRNYIFVEDLAALISNAIEHKIVGTYVVGGQEDLSIHQMMQIICDVFDIKAGPSFSKGDSSRSQLVRSVNNFTGETLFKKSLEIIKSDTNERGR